MFGGSFARASWKSSVPGERARGTYRALSELDDDMLHDIGLHRSEIASVALGVRSRVST
jgi:hypothetical protein